MKDLDAEALCRQLAEQIRPHVGPATALVGIYTGGLWLAERLHAELGIAQPLGAIDVSFYRDDYASKGLHASPKKTEIPFDVDGAHVILVDDVLYTGRTTRAALNELFDFGRPARVELAVLVDRGGRDPHPVRAARARAEPRAAARRGRPLGPRADTARLSRSRPPLPPAHR